MLIIHILIAVFSIGYCGLTYLFPTKKKLYISYGFVALTLITGSYLVLTKPAHMIQTCITGIIYLGFVTLGLVSAHKKFAKEIEKN